MGLRESFWGSMQNHWEHTLSAADALNITGDELPQGESAIVISVSVHLWQVTTSRLSRWRLI